MNDVIKYEVTTATENAVDRFDADNFYSMDGDEDDFYSMDGDEDDFYDEFSGLDTDENGVDDEFSEALGDKFRGMFKKKSTPRIGGASGGANATTKKGLFGGKIRGLISDRKAGRDDRVKGRQDRRTKRADERQRRKNLRQVALVENNTPQVQENIAKIITANTQNTPELKESVDITAEGFADQTQEQQTQVVVQEANKMAATGETTPPIIELDPTGKVTEVKDTWWKKQGTGVKVAIIGGGVVALALTVWGITKIANK
jgi:hypothetical protein